MTHLKDCASRFDYTDPSESTHKKFTMTNAKAGFGFKKDCLWINDPDPTFVGHYIREICNVLLTDHWRPIVRRSGKGYMVWSWMGAFYLWLIEAYPKNVYIECTYTRKNKMYSLTHTTVKCKTYV